MATDDERLTAILVEARDASAAARAAERFAELEINRLDQLRAADQLAVAAALAAAEKAVTAAAIASEKAINKAEEAQLRVNATQNEFRGSLDDQSRYAMPRTEAESLIRELRQLNADRQTEIGELRSRLDVGPPSLDVLQARSDHDAGRRTSGLENRALLFSLIAVLGTAAAILGFLQATAP